MSSPEVVAAVAAVRRAIDVLEALLPPMPGPSPGAVVMKAGEVTSTSITVTWSTERTDVTAWTVGRDGADSSGTGPWSTTLPAAARSQRFGLLRPGTAYVITVAPIGGDPVQLTATTTAGPPSSGGGGGVRTAAERFGWGTPHRLSDEFDYVGRPDPERWTLPPAAGWPGHGGRGRRVPECAEVADGRLVLRGLADGRAGWIRHRLPTRYGRWEQRSRSMSTGSGSSPYHVLSLIWPTREDWPRSGEYDWLEVEDPDQRFFRAYLHYPHPPGAVQQEIVTVPGVDQREWHHYAFEWSPDGLAGWIDGEEVYRRSGGRGPGGRSDLQAMPEGALTLQVDHFGGTRPCTYEIDWLRFYPLPA